MLTGLPGYTLTLNIHNPHKATCANETKSKKILFHLVVFPLLLTYHFPTFKIKATEFRKLKGYIKKEGKNYPITLLKIIYIMITLLNIYFWLYCLIMLVCSEPPGTRYQPVMTIDCITFNMGDNFIGIFLSYFCLHQMKSSSNAADRIFHLFTFKSC